MDLHGGTLGKFMPMLRTEIRLFSRNNRVFFRFSFCKTIEEIIVTLGQSGDNYGLYYQRIKFRDELP